MRHFVREIAQDRIVLQQMGQSFRVGDVVDCHNFNRRIFQRGAKNVAPDPSETINSDFNRHEASRRVRSMRTPTQASAGLLPNGDARVRGEKSQRGQSYSLTRITLSPLNVTKTVLAGGFP